MSHSHLSARERCKILLLSQYGLSQAEIARRLARHRSTISREFKRNRSPHRPYYTDLYAQAQAERRRQKVRHRRRLDHRPLVAFVTEKLRDFWPPEAIAGRLISCFPNDRTMRISAEQIYAWIATDAKSGGTLYSAIGDRPRLFAVLPRYAAVATLAANLEIIGDRPRFTDFVGVDSGSVSVGSSKQLSLGVESMRAGQNARPDPASQAQIACLSL